ncbi:hypothetical protein LOKO_01759 [Halomonas chromatireducens]|uniref:Uncharacterized protein n=1 Tax=Halomonas chromatireducens TaxID=507626 RepID=A0A0X8HDW1_9GAMM|nr:hypothetical protein LOKO_01759 [Halomonas chromatireducens]
MPSTSRLVGGYYMCKQPSRYSIACTISSAYRGAKTYVYNFTCFVK